jgi:mannosyltransferase OCH1-like enzyme
VVFVGSSEREGDGWRLVYGENDMRIVTTRVPDSEIKMEEIPRPLPRKIRPAAVNFIHFIWLQGADELPPEDQANIDQWRAMNPDWVVRVWDDDSLAELIKVRSPRCFRFWEELFKQREARPDDMALTAKASDLARLVLLSLPFEITQSWNCYADTDTRPHRPLTHFLNDDMLHGINLPRASVSNTSPSQRIWDIDNYDLLVSEENLMNPHPGSMTNAVMLARPNTYAINELLKAGEALRSKPTLQAWGPIMLRRTVEAIKRTPNGRRISVMPFHYFVWNPAQMQMPIPEWTVCTHHNKFRWNQPDIQPSRAGSARGRQPLLV